MLYDNLRKHSILFLIPLIVLTELGGAVGDDIPSRPNKVPQKARWDKVVGLWLLAETKDQMLIEQLWRKEGKAVSKTVRHKNLIQKVYRFDEDSMLLSKEQNALIFTPPSPPAVGIDPGGYEPHLYGMVTVFNKNRVAGESCYTYKEEPSTGHTISLRCNSSWGFKLNSTEIERATYPDKCLQGCGEFKPFMPPGKYKVHATSVIFRDKPSTKGKSLGMIQKDTQIEVIEDTHKIETHDFETAPWVKIKYDGKTGYVFGGLLNSLERNDL